MSELTAERLRAILDYNPESGEFTWKKRPITEFATARACSVWNARYQGTKAGSPSSTGHVLLSIGSRKYCAHRVAWLYVNGAWPCEVIDHKDGNQANNALANLRICDQSLNNANQRLRRDSTFGMKGVCQVGQRYAAQIHVRGKHVHLGMFDSPEQANLAYLNAARRYFGAFAYDGVSNREAPQ